MSVHTLREFINRSYPTVAGLVRPHSGARCQGEQRAAGSGPRRSNQGAPLRPRGGGRPGRRQRRPEAAPFLVEIRQPARVQAKLLYRADTRHLLELRDDPAPPGGGRVRPLSRTRTRAKRHSRARGTVGTVRCG